MYEPLPKMPLHLGSRASRVADMATALYWAIDEVGLRLPARRDIARQARVSEATISRRFRDSRSGEERLASVLVSARHQTYPPGWPSEGWPRWIPASELELKDVRAWLACQAVASRMPAVAEAVREVWERERAEVVRQLRGGELVADEAAPELSGHAEVVQALLMGLSIRRLLDPELTAERALELLGMVVAALGPEDAAASSPD